MVIQHNLTAINSQNQLKKVTKRQSSLTEHLSSGYKVNRAADDAAGLTISEKMRSQIRGLSQASLNCEDGISMVQIAEGALAEVHDMLQRMNEMAIKSANGTNTLNDRWALQQELNELVDEIDRVSSSTQFNTIPVLKPDYRTPMKEIGELVNEKFGNDLNVSVEGQKIVLRGSESDVSDMFSDMLYSPPGSKMYDNLVEISKKTASFQGEMGDGFFSYQQPFKYGDGTAELTLDFSYTEFYQPIAFQVGATSDESDMISVNFSGIDSSKLGIAELQNYDNVTDEGRHWYPDMWIKVKSTGPSGGCSVGGTSADPGGGGGSYFRPAGWYDLTPGGIMGPTSAKASITVIDAAIDKVSAKRSYFGAIQNRLEHTIKNLDNVVENTTAAESSIRDADMSSEMVQFANSNILSQAAQSILAQANQSKQGVLQLLS